MPAFDNNRKVAKVQGKDMNSARKVMSKPCVLINKLNVRKKRIWLVDHPEKNAVSSTEFVPLSSTMMSLGYLNYVALTDRFTNYMLNCSSGSSNSQKRVTPDDILDYVITAPSLLEQERIARFLETIDSKIRAQEDLIELLKKYKRGLHEFVFLKNRKESWKNAALKNIASFCGGGTPSKDISSYWNGNIGWISSSDIHEDWIDDISVTRRITKSAIDNSATKICPKGTIAIVSRVGVGKVAVMPENLCTSQDFTNITSITGNTRYMAYQIAFKMKIEAIKTQGTSIKGVTSNTIKSMVIDIPTLEEQDHIADMVSIFDLRIKHEICNLGNLLITKKAFLQQLFI